MYYRVRRKIKLCLESNDNVGELKQNYQSLKQPERGLITDVDQKADLPATAIQNFLPRYNSKKKTKSITLWTNFVDENLDRIVHQERAKLQEGQEALQQKHSKASTSTSPELAAIIASSFNYNHRAFHGSFKALPRQDLPHKL